ncbi:hypothetical protein ANCDUO_03982, partial [Ancylostoma duodenale]
LFEGHELKNGINIVSLNGSTGDIEQSASFDVAESDGKLISWLRIKRPISPTPNKFSVWMLVKTLDSTGET